MRNQLPKSPHTAPRVSSSLRRHASQHPHSYGYRPGMHTGSPPPAASPPPRRGQSSQPPQEKGCEVIPWHKPLDLPPPAQITPLKVAHYFLMMPRNLMLLLPCIIFPMSMGVYRFMRFGASLVYLTLITALSTIVYYTSQASPYDISAVTRMPARTIIYDMYGEVIGTLHGENRHMIKDLSEVPEYFIDALTLQEDRRFWTHTGVDPVGLVRACMQVLKHYRTTQGASTLTMQLAKNTYDHQDRSFHNKFIEIALARRIEAMYGKEEIILCYINRIFWGHSFRGLKQATRGYFNKEVSELTIAESALLAAIIKNPNNLSPHRNPTFAKEARDQVLALMQRRGSITYMQYQEALAEPIRTEWPAGYNNENYAMNTVRKELEQIVPELEQKGIISAADFTENGGLIINTTLDLKLQNKALEEINSHIEQNIESAKGYRHQTRAQYQRLRRDFYAGKSKKKYLAEPEYLQVACVIIHNQTGAIRSVIGGRDSKDSDFNRALQSLRPVGSTIKPFIFASYFERGGKPTDKISDGKIAVGEIKGFANWSPRNSNGVFGGMREAREGLLKSRNTMTARVGNQVGLANVIADANKAGLINHHRKPLGPTIYLGTWESTPREIASSYTTFANGGVRADAYLIDSIVDRTGRIIWKRKAKHTQVYSVRANAQTLDILQEITKTGTAAAMKKIGYLSPAGGKTGTTNRYRDAWFCGFNSELTSVVWLGFDSNKTIMDKGYGAALALPIWVKVMNTTEKLNYIAGEILRYAPNTALHGKELQLGHDRGNIAHHVSTTRITGSPSSNEEK